MTEMQRAQEALAALERRARAETNRPARRALQEAAGAAAQAMELLAVDQP